MTKSRYLVLLKAITNAQIEAMGMQAENALRIHRGEVPAYNDMAFFEVQERLATIWKENPNS